MSKGWATAGTADRLSRCNEHKTGEWKMEEQTQAPAAGRPGGLNRDVIKYVAMVTMLLNHIAHMFLTKGTPTYEVLEDIGFFTAPVMCYFLVEGYGYTRSKLQYGLRLFLFALLSQIPFRLAFGNKGLNMIFTLLCCFLILVVIERVSSPLLQTALCVLLTMATVAADWPLVAPILTVMLANGMGNRKKLALGFGAAYFIFAMLNTQNYMFGEKGDWTPYAMGHAALSGLGILAAGAVVLFFYNGKRAQRGRNFAKWFFYIFYPAHLFVLYFIKMGLHNM